MFKTEDENNLKLPEVESDSDHADREFATSDEETKDPVNNEQAVHEPKPAFDESTPNQGASKTTKKWAMDDEELEDADFNEIDKILAFKKMDSTDT